MRIQQHNNRRDWLLARYGGIGASEAAAVLGVSRFGSPWSVWQAKVDKPEPDFGELNDLMEWGHRHEPTIATKLGEELRNADNSSWTDWLMHDPGEFTAYWADDPPWLFCTPDRLLADPDGKLLAVCELKCAWYDAAREWKTAIPLAYRIQTQVQMHCLEVDRCYYAVLLNGHEFRWFTEPRNNKFIASLIRRLTKFWERHVLTGIAPATDWTDATAGAIAAHYAIPEDTEIILPAPFEQHYRDREAWKAEIKGLGKKVAAIENGIRAELGEATCGIIPGEHGAYTWLPDKNGRRRLRFKPKGEDDE